MLQSLQNWKIQILSPCSYIVASLEQTLWYITAVVKTNKQSPTVPTFPPQRNCSTASAWDFSHQLKWNFINFKGYTDCLCMGKLKNMENLVFHTLNTNHVSLPLPYFFSSPTSCRTQPQPFSLNCMSPT